MAKDKEPISSEDSVRIHKIHAIADAVVKLGSEAFKWGSLGAIAYFFAPSFEALAGKETTPNFSLELLMNKHFATIMAILFGTGGIVYGRKQAKLRKDTIERLHQYQVKHETEKDLKRTSSQLSPRGDTRKEDM